MNMTATYNIFQAFKVEEVVETLDEKIKQLEVELDLKDYYDIKRPTVVFFSIKGK